MRPVELEERMAAVSAESMERESGTGSAERAVCVESTERGASTEGAVGTEAASSAS